MQKLYRVKGLLDSGFVGQITYTVCLPDQYEEMDIAFSFEKQHFPSMEAAPQEEINAYCMKTYGIPIPEEQKERAFLREMKTEIHLMATLNDIFIGCIHRQLLERHMHFSKAELTEGCIMPQTLEGVLKVTVLVFNVLMDETPYELAVYAGRQAGGTEHV